MKIIHNQMAFEVPKNSFSLENHYYHKVVNAQIHPLVQLFMTLSQERIIQRYCHLNPKVNKSYLGDLLRYQTKNLLWSGTDLFHVTTEDGHHEMIVIENNSSPSGQKSMPLLNDDEEMGGYKRLLEQSFLPFVKAKRTIEGVYVVMYDKNEMEASGYAYTLAQLVSEPVYLVAYFNEDASPGVCFKDEIMYIKVTEDEWIPVKAAFRYVTQKPWNRIPVKTKTIIYNPVVACLAGGRNKRMASKAYDLFNAELNQYGLNICVPETIKDVKIHEVPLWVERFGGHAVVKIPYSNAGQGVYTITSKEELNAFMEAQHDYEDVIVQSLIGNYGWSTKINNKQYYHVGLMPNKQHEIYVADLRLMVASTEMGLRPMAMYARKAAKPLKDHLEPLDNSWAMLGTNLSVRLDDGWDSEVKRLKLMDQKDFGQLGLSLDHLIEGYIQSVMSTIAIDRLSESLMNSKRQLRRKLFEAMNGDPLLVQEIVL